MDALGTKRRVACQDSVLHTEHRVDPSLLPSGPDDEDMEMPGRPLADRLPAVDQHEGLGVAHSLLREAMCFGQEEAHQLELASLAGGLDGIGAQHEAVLEEPRSAYPGGTEVRRSSMKRDIGVFFGVLARRQSARTARQRHAGVATIRCLATARNSARSRAEENARFGITCPSWDEM